MNSVTKKNVFLDAQACSLIQTYVVCPKSKCTDIPMYELATQDLVDEYRYVGSDLGCMSILVSNGLVEPVVRYCYLCMVVFSNLVMLAMEENIE